MARILIADDEEGFRNYLESALASAGHEVEAACDGRHALEILARSEFDVLVTDIQMPRMNGTQLLKQVRVDRPEIQIVVLTGVASVASAVEAIRSGAYDYIEKPPRSIDDLLLTIGRAVERRELIAYRDSARRSEPAELPLTYGAPSMQPVVASLLKVAPTNATVLLVGESGTGKEVAARAIHRHSQRADRPFVAINCAALAEGLLESELFGHEKGAFTGAVVQRRGRLELAHGGTLFLDEIGELKPHLQVKLLRVLQERTFERVGGSQSLKADVRWISATNADLDLLIADGGFREDLYHRLAVFPIRIPGLRERPEDTVPLARHLIGIIASDLGRPGLTLSSAAELRLQNAPWRGNVRELRNVLERAAIICPGSVIDGEDLLVGPVSTGPRPTTNNLADVERDTIVRVLAEHGNNRKKAAEILGIALRTLYDKLNRYGLHKKLQEGSRNPGHE